MASATNNDEKTMAEEELADGNEEGHGGKPSAPAASEHPSFFTIYKKGQGYWTRVGTAVGGAMFVALTANFIYTRIPPEIDWLNEHTAWLNGIVAVFLVGSIALIWKLMNRPQSTDFLIATDSEMKKVNWTSRAELIGSTKVVILFMFMIAGLLFMLDLYFTRLFYLVGVLAGDAPLWEIVGRRYGSGAKIVLDVIMGVIVLGSAAWGVMASTAKR
ncbi:MAG TPA: preprotein translocase subunit SecE [Tepidisphaeraceae bacterium]|nr:preprotein translocase subunit SecE [Tepidisphaeraceae bacterium]